MRNDGMSVLIEKELQRLLILSIFRGFRCRMPPNLTFIRLQSNNGVLAYLIRPPVMTLPKVPAHAEES